MVFLGNVVICYDMVRLLDSCVLFLHFHLCYTGAAMKDNDDQVNGVDQGPASCFQDLFNPKMIFFSHYLTQKRHFWLVDPKSS